MAVAQEKALGAFLADLGLTGFSGIAATIDGTTNTTLDITVTQPAWSVHPDGTVLASELQTTTITGNSTNGSYHLYLDYATSGKQGTSYAPVWTVAASAPSSNALLIADVTVASNHLTVVTMKSPGLAGLNIQGASTTTAPSAGGGSALPATPAGYLTVTINGQAQKIAYY